MDQLGKNQTLELNAAHPLVVNLNALRKKDQKAAGLVARQLLDNVMVESGIPFNIQAGTERQYTLLNNYLDLLVNNDDVETEASRKTIDLDGGALN